MMRFLGHLCPLVSILVVGLILGLAEVVFTRQTIPWQQLRVSPALYVLGITVLTVFFFALHAVPVGMLFGLLSKLFPKARGVARWVPWLILATLFGLGWQETIIHGDGIRSLVHYETIRLGLLVAAPMAMVTFTWLFLLPYTASCSLLSRTGVAVRYVCLSLVFGATVFINFNALIGYRTFHGFLTLFNGVILLRLLWPLGQKKWWNKAQRCFLAIFIVAGAITLWHQNTLVRHALRYSTTPAAMADLPAGRLLLGRTGKVFHFMPKWSAEEEAIFREGLAARLDGIGEAGPRGKNVLLVVLEAIRWDYWGDPLVAPRFHRWRKHGLYMPYGIAQYPATPLAYGAIFAAQPPSVLALSDHWAKHRLFDLVADRFDRLILSMPSNSWFDHSAINGFFLTGDEPINRHVDARAGMAHIRHQLRGLTDEERFFAWVHLYEAHSPYQFRKAYDKGGKCGRDRAYRSEIAYVDDQLGQFMEWFMEQPMAQQTLVIVIGDHGQGMGEKIMGESFFGHHVHVHSLISRIPMFFAGEGLPKGEVAQGELVTAQMDIMPTIFDHLGVPIPGEMAPQGWSLYQLYQRLQSGQYPDRILPTEAFPFRGGDFFNFVAKAADTDDWQSALRRYRLIADTGLDYSQKFAIQLARHKMVYDRTLDRHWLYDVLLDPMEEVDLALTEPDLFEQMKARFDLWSAQQSWHLEQLDLLQ